MAALTYITLFSLISMFVLSRRVALTLLISSIAVTSNCRKVNISGIVPADSTKLSVLSDTVAFKNMLGVNAFEWNFLQDPGNPNNGMQIYEPKMELIKSFAGVRHYLDWEKIEPQKGKYTFNPTRNGGWNLDVMYQRSKADGIDMLVCLKTCPPWLLETYPANERDAENVPMPYGSNKADPQSYILQAKAAFQFAARYGRTKITDLSQLSVDVTPRWTGDPVNEVKTGLGLVKYIECDNERDKWWKGDKAYQKPEEYAANLSAFYDGNKGKLGKGVGVKTADPNMMVVMAGLAKTDVAYVNAMIDWCKNNRGYKANGAVDLCFDVINFHLYANDHLLNSSGNATKGIAPELSEAGKVAADFVKLGNTYHLPVWVTEAGYDVNANSPQRAVKIGNKSEQLTQADWNLRTALLYARYGIKKLFFYELYDDNIANPTQYASSGFITADLKRRPAADYILQVKSLLGNYSYRETISQNPLVDVYKSGSKTIYAMVSPSQEGKAVAYNLTVPAAKQFVVYQPIAGALSMAKRTEKPVNGTLKITVTETPLFVEVQ
jgi:hypothetical protein